MFDHVWSRIEQCQGQEFYTKTGRPFRYKVESSCVMLDRTERNLPISHFKAVHAMGSVAGPGAITKQDPKIQGTSYVWAILNDSRIADGLD